MTQLAPTSNVMKFTFNGIDQLERNAARMTEYVSVNCSDGSAHKWMFDFVPRNAGGDGSALDCRIALIEAERRNMPVNIEVSVRRWFSRDADDEPALFQGAYRTEPYNYNTVGGIIRLEGLVIFSRDSMFTEHVVDVQPAFRCVIRFSVTVYYNDPTENISGDRATIPETEEPLSAVRIMFERLRNLLSEWLRFNGQPENTYSVTFPDFLWDFIVGRRVAYMPGQIIEEPSIPLRGGYDAQQPVAINTLFYCQIGGDIEEISNDFIQSLMNFASRPELPEENGEPSGNARASTFMAFASDQQPSTSAPTGRDNSTIWNQSSLDTVDEYDSNRQKQSLNLFESEWKDQAFGSDLKALWDSTPSVPIPRNPWSPYEGGLDLHFDWKDQASGLDSGASNLHAPNTNPPLNLDPASIYDSIPAMLQTISISPEPWQRNGPPPINLEPRAALPPRENVPDTSTGTQITQTRLNETSRPKEHPK